MPMLIDVAELAGLAVEGPLYGVFLCLFCTSAYDLLTRRARGDARLNWPMVFTGVSLILLATARFTLDVAYLFIAFFGKDPRAARIAFLRDVHVQLFIAKHATLLTSLLIGDCFMAYRCWVVWGKNIWVATLPVLCSIAGTSCGAYTLWAYTHRPDEEIFTEVNILKICFILSLVSNALSTSLLAFRIWNINHQREKATRAPTGLNSRSVTAPIVRIVLESGAINAAFLFAFVMMLVENSPNLELVSNMSVPVTGLVFCIVIFRVGLRQRSDSERYTAGSESGGPTRISWAPAKVMAGGKGATAGPRAASVHVTTTRTDIVDAPDAVAARRSPFMSYKSDSGAQSDLEFIEMDSKVSDRHFGV